MAVAESESEVKVELNEVESAKVKALFACIDTNEDGKIDITEVHAHLASTYESESAASAGIEGFMKRYDENKDNMVSEEEMTHYFVHMKERLTKAGKAEMVMEILGKMVKEHQSKVSAEERALVDKYFLMFDRDDNGAIALDEMKGVLNDENLRLKKFLERFDANKDRKVTHDEVMLYCCNIKTRIAKNPNINLTTILEKMIDAQMPKPGCGELDSIELRKVQQLFLCYDANGDGQIELKEVQDQLKSSASSEAAGVKAVEGFLNRYDENKDGVVDIAEMQKYILDMKIRLAKKDKEELVKTILDKMIAEQAGKLDEEERKLVDQYFGMFDANNDGLIDLGEMKDQLNEEDVRIAGYMKRFDENKDNKISKTEVLLYCVNTKLRIANNPKVTLTVILNNMIKSQQKETVAEN